MLSGILGRALARSPHFLVRLLQPERHVHLAVPPRRGGEVLARSRWPERGHSFPRPRWQSGASSTRWTRVIAPSGGGDNRIVMVAPRAAHLGRDSRSAGTVLQLERRDPTRPRNALDGQVAAREHVQHYHR